MSRRIRVTMLVFIALASVLYGTACAGDQPANDAPENGRLSVKNSSVSVAAELGPEAMKYAGSDDHGVPRYFKGALGADAATILRRAFGVLSPSNLYISDSSRSGLLKYDPQRKPCRTCYVNSYRIGFVSVRRPGESWEDLQRRLSTLTRKSFPKSLLITSSSIASMDPDIQTEVSQMLQAARRAGFQTRIVSTYRSPQQEAVLMREGGGRTHTLTSLHSYGRAIDIRIDDGNLNRLSTRRDWIAFRRWVTHFRGDDFRVLGTADKSWDWPHVELPSDRIGFHSVDAAVTAGRACLAGGSAAVCEFPPHLPRTLATGGVSR